MKISPRPILVCLFILIAAFPACADETAVDNKQTEEAAQNMEKLKSTSKKVLQNVGDALNDAGTVIEKKAKSFTSKACLGTWVFTNGKAVTAIECNEDGSMEISEKSGFTAKYWKGSYSSTSTTITFRVMFTGSKGFVGKSSDIMDASWVIDYKVWNDSEMKFSSDDVPNDANGYDFSNPAIFKKQ
jgi:hypothetical protein